MAEGRRQTAALICLMIVCFLRFSTGTGIGTPAMAVAAERKLQVNNQSSTWCVVKPSTPQEKLEKIIDYCCTQPGVDCRVIQKGGECYFPPNIVSDASVVMNIYYKLSGKHSFNCYFDGSGLIVNKDPSVGKCIYPA